jgi:hypothetical protein
VEYNALLCSVAPLAPSGGCRPGALRRPTSAALQSCSSLISGISGPSPRRSAGSASPAPTVRGSGLSRCSARCGSPCSPCRCSSPGCLDRVLTELSVARSQQSQTMSYRELWRHLVELRRHSPHLLGLLLASALFRDGLAAVFVFLPMVAHGSVGLSAAELVVFATASSVIAAAGAVAGGVFDDRVGPTTVIVGSLIGPWRCCCSSTVRGPSGSADLC